MSYHVACECGRSVPVAASAAGSSVRCWCGRDVEVPPLHVLRLSAGQDVLAPEVRLRAMLDRGELPGTAGCVVCGRPTDALGEVAIECERAVVESRADRTVQAQGCLIGLLFGHLVYIRAPREQRTLGQDVVFTVPVRLCDPCWAETTRPGPLHDALRKTPAYAALLDKYPKARIARVG